MLTARLELFQLLKKTELIFFYQIAMDYGGNEVPWSRKSALCECFCCCINRSLFTTRKKYRFPDNLCTSNGDVLIMDSYCAIFLSIITSGSRTALSYSRFTAMLPRASCQSIKSKSKAHSINKTTQSAVISTHAREAFHYHCKSERHSINTTPQPMEILQQIPLVGDSLLDCVPHVSLRC